MAYAAVMGGGVGLSTGLVVVAVSDMGAKVERALERAKKIEQRELKADMEALERDAAA